MSRGRGPAQSSLGELWQQKMQFSSWLFFCLFLKKHLLNYLLTSYNNSYSANNRGSGVWGKPHCVPSSVPDLIN